MLWSDEKLIKTGIFFEFVTAKKNSSAPENFASNKPYAPIKKFSDEQLNRQITCLKCSLKNSTGTVICLATKFFPKVSLSSDCCADNEFHIELTKKFVQKD